jgi:hypothetical protein
MNELLNLALEAHGGLDRWNKVKAIKVAASITGAIWYVKGKADFLKNVVLTSETRHGRLPRTEQAGDFRAEPHHDRNRGRNPDRSPRQPGGVI